MASMIVLCSLIAVALAGNINHGGAGGAGGVGGGLPAPLGAGLAGTSSSFRRQDPFQYSFGYDITDNLGASNGRRESGDITGNKFGSYNIRDLDGRVRTVNYIADKDGFRARINSNEPGVISHQAADATYNGANVLTINHAEVYSNGGLINHNKHH